MSDQPWFKTRRYGLGARPVTWQGYLLSFVVFIVLLFGLNWIYTHHVATDPVGIAVAVALIVVVTSAVMVISARKSDKPWRWRWGQDD